MPDASDAGEPGRELVPVPKPEEPVGPEPVPGPGIVDLVTRSAKVGLDAVGLAAGDVMNASVRFARAVLPPAIAERPLDAVGQEIDRRLDEARRRDKANREEAAEAVHAVVNKTIGVAIDQVDMAALVQKIPIEEMLESVDIGSIIRGSTSNLAGETADAIRVEVMGLDLFAARMVDKVFRRKHPRSIEFAGYDVTGPEFRPPQEMTKEVGRVTRVIKNTRAVDLQGKRAGFFSRAIASGIDLGIAFVLLLGIIFVVQAVGDLIANDTIAIQSPNPGASGSGMILIFTLYLAIGWGSTGRTIGKQVMGLRVVRADTEPLRPIQALGRGLLCAVFYPCLLLALFHRRNAGLEDLVCRTVVVYDWIPESARRRMPTPVAGAVSREAGA